MKEKLILNYNNLKMDKVAEFFCELHEVSYADVLFLAGEIEQYGLSIFDVGYLLYGGTDGINKTIINTYKIAVKKFLPNAEFIERDTSVPSFVISSDGKEVGEMQANCLASSITFYDQEMDDRFLNSF